MTDRQVRSGRQNATARIRKSATPVKQKVINLALQGGGAHGALAWRVLDRLLEDERIMIDGISATSAGAMNAAMVAYGWAIGGRDGARRSLATFWQRIGDAAATSLPRPTWLDRMMGNDSPRFSPAFAIFDCITRLLSQAFDPLRVHCSTLSFARGGQDVLAHLPGRRSLRCLLYRKTLLACAAWMYRCASSWSSKRSRTRASAAWATASTKPSWSR